MWRHVTPQLKVTAFRSPTRTTTCSFGRAQPMPTAKSWTIEAPYLKFMPQFFYQLLVFITSFIERMQISTNKLFALKEITVLILLRFTVLRQQ